MATSPQRLVPALLALAAAGCTLPFDECLIESRCATATSTRPSCETLEANCGEGRNCCEAPAVSGGVFQRGTDASGSDTDVAGWVEGGVEATVSTFALDTFEVTVGRFRRFLDDYDAWRAAGNPPSEPGWEQAFPLAATAIDVEASLSCGSDASWTAVAGANENLPINCVTWHVAYAFCKWDGARLPSEAEWHYAASGGNEQRAYPWSDPPGDITNPELRAVLGDVALELVGQRPAGAGRFGQFGMAGNVREWTMDTWRSDDDYLVPCVDCVQLASGSARVRKGADHLAPAARGRSARRSNWAAEDALSANGIRCAADVRE